MKKLGLMAACIVLGSSVQAHKFTHHAPTIQLKSSAQILPQNRVDLSGTWVGTCSDWDLSRLDIHQSDTGVTTTFYDADMRQDTPATFIFNKFKMETITSPGKTHLVTVYARWDSANQLALSRHENILMGSYEADAYSSWMQSDENIRLVLDNDKLYLSDLFENPSQSEPCVLSKMQD